MSIERAGAQEEKEEKEERKTFDHGDDEKDETTINLHSVAPLKVPRIGMQAMEIGLSCAFVDPWYEGAIPFVDRWVIRFEDQGDAIRRRIGRQRQRQRQRGRRKRDRRSGSAAMGCGAGHGADHGTIRHGGNSTIKWMRK